MRRNSSDHSNLIPTGDNQIMKPGIYLEEALKDVLRTSNLACSVFYHSIYAYSSRRELSTLIINSTFLHQECVERLNRRQEECFPSGLCTPIPAHIGQAFQRL